MTLRKCDNCGKDFRPLRGNQKLCPVCKTKKKKDPVVYHRICDFCSKPFDTTVPNKLCCTHECTLAKHKDHSHDTTKICPVCKKSFVTGNSNKIHCSSECAKVTKYAYDKKWMNEHPGYMEEYKSKNAIEES